MGCAFLDIARPANGDPDGVYFIVVRAKKYFRTGHVLPHIDRRTGEVDRTRPMSIGDFVAFLHSALVTIGLSKEEAALFAGRARGPGALLRPRPRGCTKRTYSTSRASPQQNGSPGTTADSCRSGCAFHAPSAYETSKEEGRCLGKEMCLWGGTLPSAFYEEGARAPTCTASPKHPNLACLVSPWM